MVHCVHYNRMICWTLEAIAHQRCYVIALYKSTFTFTFTFTLHYITLHYISEFHAVIVQISFYECRQLSFVRLTFLPSRNRTEPGVFLEEFNRTRHERCLNPMNYEPKPNPITQTQIRFPSLAVMTASAADYSATRTSGKLHGMSTLQRHGSLLTFWRFTNRIIIIIIIIAPKRLRFRPQTVTIVAITATI